MQPIPARCDWREETCPHLAQPEVPGISTSVCLIKAEVFKVIVFNITNCRFCSPTTGQVDLILPDPSTLNNLFKAQSPTRVASWLDLPKPCAQFWLLK